MIQKPPPILVVDRFPDLLNALLNLLENLSAEEWQRPTVAAGWNVHDIALHLLGDEIGILSRKRDNFREASVTFTTWDELVSRLNERNNRWVTQTRRISPRLTCDLLKFTADQANAYFSSLDMYMLGGPVSWAGPEPAPVWLDIAREFTERWHHQQHIRDAVSKPGLTEPRFLKPVLATFVHSLPQAYQQIESPDGTAIILTIIGDAGGSWSVIREAGQWCLYAGKSPQPNVEVVLSENIAWRLFTKGITQEFARGQAIFRGDQEIGEQLLKAVAIIA